MTVTLMYKKKKTAHVQGHCDTELILILIVVLQHLEYRGLNKKF